MFNCFNASIGASIPEQSVPILITISLIYFK